MTVRRSFYFTSAIAVRQSGPLRRVARKESFVGVFAQPQRSLYGEFLLSGALKRVAGNGESEPVARGHPNVQNKSITPLEAGTAGCPWTL
jgi:hypothetical protein